MQIIRILCRHKKGYVLNSLFFLSVIFITPAHAYLDPGTGSMLLSMIIALIATLIYSVKSFTFKIKSLVARLFGKKIKKIESSDIVFYNEGEQYFTTFYPILKELDDRGVKFTYLYSEENDSIVKKITDIDAHYIGKGNKAFFRLNTLQAKICIMTTPGLDVLQIKRSKGVHHYCHLTHSTNGCFGYEVFGTDYFDSVLVPNKYDMEFIKALEKKRNLPQKDIRIVGTPYMDFAFEQLKMVNIHLSTQTTILISPTWGENGLLNKYGHSLLEILLSCDVYSVIVRPHPQSIRYEKEMLEDLHHRFKDNKNLQWDYDNSGLLSMAKASIMISEFSGIILDFILLFSRPVISIFDVIDMRGKDYVDEDKPSWFIDFYHNNTEILKEENIVHIGQIIDSLVHSNNATNIGNYEDYNPYSRGASIKTVDAIESIYKIIQDGEK